MVIIWFNDRNRYTELHGDHTSSCLFTACYCELSWDPWSTKLIAVNTLLTMYKSKETFNIFNKNIIFSIRLSPKWCYANDHFILFRRKIVKKILTIFYYINHTFSVRIEIIMKSLLVIPRCITRLWFPQRAPWRATLG